jgi:hypothetical protein
MSKVTDSARTVCSLPAQIVRAIITILALTVVAPSARTYADPTIIQNVKGRADTPILLIGGDFDNATPLSWTRRLARTLGMERSIIRYQGGGHGAATSGNACIADVLVKYLFDLAVPAEGFSCPGQPIQFGAPAAQKEIDGARAVEDLRRDGLWGRARLTFEREIK